MAVRKRVANSKVLVVEFDKLSFGDVGFGATLMPPEYTGHVYLHCRCQVCSGFVLGSTHV